MGMLYDVFTYSKTGRRHASFDSNTSHPRIEIGVYTEHVNTNWDRHVYWYDPEGKPIDRDDLPWVVAAAEEEDRLRRKEEMRRFYATNEFWHRVMDGALRAREGDIRIEVSGWAIDGLIVQTGRSALECHESSYRLGITTYRGEQQIGSGSDTLGTWRKAIAQWADVPLGNDVRVIVYRLIATVLP